MKPIQVYVDKNTSGHVVRESLLVDELSADVFKLMASPGLVLGLARGDVFKLDPVGRPILIQRAGNIAIQIYRADGASNQHSKIEDAILNSLDYATLDGIIDQQLVFTVPATEGFPKIEKVLNAAVASVQGYEWYFGNVYDPADGITPLNWWIKRDETN